MDEVAKLEHLSLVSKVCTELENHLGMNDKDLGKKVRLTNNNLFLNSFFLLAEFIIDLSEKHKTYESFKKVLLENGAEFSDSFIANLLRIIQHMRPTKTQASDVPKSTDNDFLAVKFPGLAIPNESKPIALPVDDEKEKKIEVCDVKKVKLSEDKIIDDAMAELEALAPSFSGVSSKNESESKPKRLKSDKSELKSEKKRYSSRERSRDRKYKRERSRERRRSRSKEGRSRDRRHRSRSRERRRKSRSRSRNRDRKHERERDFEKRNKRESPEVEDDPEPGKVS